MNDRRRDTRNRTLLGGKIIFNNRQSVIDCIVRNRSDTGACLQLNDTAGMPPSFELLIDGESENRNCQVVWQSDTRAGIEFRQISQGTGGEGLSPGAHPPSGSERASAHAAVPTDAGLLRGELLALRAALDSVPIGIVLLDAHTRAQFINRACRRMWRLPDETADSRPPFVALMYHGRDTQAYAVRPDDLDAYVTERVLHVKAGNPKPLDLRLGNGEVVRLQCTVLPSGGRMLCYTYVTDIVRHSDELEMLRGSLDQMQSGIILLDGSLNAQFMNRAVRELWHVSDETAERKPGYAELANDARNTGALGVPPEQLEEMIAGRIAVVRAGDPAPIDIPHADGRTIRSQCSVLPHGGRMVTYTDVTDLVSRANRYEQLATVDPLTGLSNRRAFDALAAAEWSRFQRYHRPLSLILMDVDRFKSINDRLGHESGDAALRHIAALCIEGKRSPDLVARIGGDEFALLLPETNSEQARKVAERVRLAIADRPSFLGDVEADDGRITVSIGIATATASMSGPGALMRAADERLYDAKKAGRNCSMVARDADGGWRDAAE